MIPGGVQGEEWRRMIMSVESESEKGKTAALKSLRRRGLYEPADGDVAREWWPRGARQRALSARPRQSSLVVIFLFNYDSYPGIYVGRASYVDAASWVSI